MVASIQRTVNAPFLRFLPRYIKGAMKSSELFRNIDPIDPLPLSITPSPL